MAKHRKSIRLKNYDYSQSGLYFVTICTQNRECIFGNIINNNVGVGRDRPISMILNQYGKIIENVWESLPNHHSVELDVFQIMPNHVHFILHIVLGASRRAPTTLGFIVGMFKTECTKQINKLRNTPGQKIFQRNYYEHIIQNENELIKIRQYIKTNPLFWNQDINYRK
ncbi:transposase [Candidatus Roizmanbacteria bacterium CG_4_9_14_0_8_um_filter_34_12]|uniref:Transposase n=1 Tax=Candidatus Roizmanbacteria bacterium CG_4_9_14_0_8_um_filter_34_12 TaxID=1974840 RepID=A0A2M8DCR6_9BACT|nr:MAG: transposase [Candidatus Roizmanbacteria bacterium CG_4_9_14_0_8_um_filter_34_12]